MLVPILLGAGAAVTTTAGGLVAIRVEDRRHLILGLAGGVLLGVVAFDLLPEAFDGSSASMAGLPAPMVTFVAGFLTIHIVEKALELHHGTTGHYTDHAHDLRPLGLLAGAALVGHSFLDGLSIGVSSTVGAAVVTVVTVAVLAHDFADGFNTYTLTAMYGNTKRRAITLLVADALAPVAGAAIGSTLHLSSGAIALYLAFFAGFLLHVATSNILPEAHADHPSWSTLAATIAGIVLMGIVMTIAG